MPVGLNQGAWQQGTGYTALNQGAWQGFPDPVPPTPTPTAAVRNIAQTQTKISIQIGAGIGMTFLLWLERLYETNTVFKYLFFQKW